MIFNDRADENFANNVRSCAQLAEKKQKTVKDVVYVLETAIVSNPDAKRPQNLRKRHIYANDPFFEEVIRVEGLETDSIFGFDRTGKTKPFEHSASDDDAVPNQPTEPGSAQQPLPGKHSFQVSPFNPNSGPLVNGYVEETWK